MRGATLWGAVFRDPGAGGEEYVRTVPVLYTCTGVVREKIRQICI